MVINMKTCNYCGTQNEDQANFCASCGSSDFSAAAADGGQAVCQPPAGQMQAYPENTPPTYPAAGAPYAEPDDNGNGNVIAGIVGAFLFSLIGGLVYFVIYQLGIIAGISGLIIFVLANFGYGLFTKTKKTTTAALVVSIIVAVVMIFLAEYICLSFEIFKVYKDIGITFFDAIRATPRFLSEPEVTGAVAKDLVSAYAFGFIATIGNIVSMVKAKKRGK